MNDDVNRVHRWIEMDDRRFNQIERMVEQAAAGDHDAGEALGKLTDREFSRWMQVRRMRRLEDNGAIVEATQAKQAPVPAFPARTGSAGTSGNGVMQGDPPAVRGVERILLALQAG